MRGRSFYRKYTAGITCLFLFSVSLSLSVFTSGNVDVNLKSAGTAVLSTIQKGFSATAGFITGTFNSISELRSLEEKYTALQKELSLYRRLQRDFTGLQEENTLLKRELDFVEMNDFSLVPAQVIAKDPSDFTSGITIDKGSADGITKDAAVVAYADGFQGLVGKISEVSRYYSKIIPIFEPDSYVASRLQRTRYEGLVEGNGIHSKHLTMRYVIKRAKDSISVGDIVITSGMNSLFPKNIYIGRIREIRSKEWNPDIELLVEPFVDFEKLEYVHVLRNEENEK